MTTYTEVRLSHLLRYSAPGAIIRGADYLMVLMDTRYWVKQDSACVPIGDLIPRTKVVSARIAEGRELRFPPTARLDSKKQPSPKQNLLPAVYFPHWAYCSSCSKMYRNPWYDREKNTQIDQPRCTNGDCSRQPILKQLPWVLVHKHGYLDEIPWHFLTHRHASGDQLACKDDKNLYFHKKGREITLKCKSGACKGKGETGKGKVVEKLPDAELRAKVLFSKYKNMQQQPWIRDPIPEEAYEDEHPVALEIGDSGIFVPIQGDALVIPPESRMLSDSYVSQLQGTQDLSDLKSAKDGPPQRYKSLLNLVADKYSCTVDELKNALVEIQNTVLQDEIIEACTDEQLLEFEYQALLTEIDNFQEDEDFVTHHYTNEWKDLVKQQDYPEDITKIISLVSRVISVKRLRKIQVYKGFHRINGSDYIIPPDIEQGQEWLPAIELFGEGVFITLDENTLIKWERLSIVIDRTELIKKRWQSSALNYDQIDLTPRFLLLHTLAHLMIRQIESEAGYPAASLEERIYSQESTGHQTPSMAGILIYVAVPDKAGSLGGLIDITNPTRLISLLESVFKKADWCSLDPVCSEHEGQGPDQLNRAACHGCSLIPDTACSYGNVLLDRTFIKGGSIDQIKSSLNNDINELIKAIKSESSISKIELLTHFSNQYSSKFKEFNIEVISELSTDVLFTLLEGLKESFPSILEMSG